MERSVRLGRVKSEEGRGKSEEGRRKSEERGSYVNSPAKGIRSRIVIVKDDEQADSQGIHKTDLT